MVTSGVWQCAFPMRGVGGCTGGVVLRILLVWLRCHECHERTLMVGRAVSHRMDGGFGRLESGKPC